MRICQLNVFIKYVKTRNVGSIMSISSKRTILLFVIFVGLGVPVAHEILFGTFNIWKRYCYEPTKHSSGKLKIIKCQWKSMELLTYCIKLIFSFDSCVRRPLLLIISCKDSYCMNCTISNY